MSKRALLALTLLASLTSPALPAPREELGFLFEAVGDALRAEHPRQELSVEISEERVLLSDREAGRGLAFRLLSLNGIEVGDAHLEHEGSRASLVRPELTEWYVHGPAGLEQGFTLAEAPPGSAQLSLELEVAAEGYEVHAVSDQRIELTSGERSIVVSGLYAYDAAGRMLPARMALSEGSLRLDVDAEGARYPVVIDPVWAEVQLLTASDGSMGARLGWSVAVSGDTAVLGAPFQATSLGGARGAAYVFVRGPTGWVEQAKLSASDGVSGDRFGAAVAISGDTVVVGAPSDMGVGAASGSAYVFTRTGTSWAFDRQLTASDAAASDEFGGAVSIDGDRIAIGARNNGVGTVYVFVRGAGTWTEEAILTRIATTLTAGFGISVSISGSSVLVGADLADGPGGTDSGAAYVFVRSGSTWTEQATLNSLANAGDHFGRSVALSGNDAIVGAPDYNGGYTDVGIVRFYQRSGVTWSLAPDTGDGLPTRRGGERFGTSVSLSGDLAIAGAPGTGTSGMAAIWQRSTGVWRGVATPEPSDGVSGDLFGSAVAMGMGPHAFIGRRGTRTVDVGGTVYVWAFVDADGTTCTSGATCRSGLCVDGVCCDGACGGGALDCQACSVAAGGTANGTCTALSATGAPLVTCRAAADLCDRAEVCSSTSMLCPSDGLASAGTACRAASCSGSTETRAASCDGVTVSCPASSTAACDPFVCGTTACLLSCGTDGDCVAGRVCAGGSCVLPAPDAGMPDAGVDAGESDAGAIELDAGGIDAAIALDAGPGDAGPGDAGPGDAGLRPDAGAADGGADAGTTPVAGGCACSTRTRGGAPQRWGLLFMLVALLVRFRR